MMKDWLVRYQAQAAAGNAQEEPSSAVPTRALPHKLLLSQRAWGAFWVKKGKDAVPSHNVVRMELLGCANVQMAIRNMPFRGLRELRLTDFEVLTPDWVPAVEALL
jgi:hypothetical protein